MGGARAAVRPGQVVLAAVCFPLATGMYYFNSQAIHLGVDVLYKMLFAIALAVVSFVAFLVHTDLARGRELVRYVGLLTLPHLAAIVISLPLWVLNMTALWAVRRGLFAELYCVGLIVAGAGLFYLFGRGGLWLNLAAMLAANLVTIVRIIRQVGLGEYWQELKTLVLSFGAQPTGAIAQAEIHELTFALGLYLTFLLLDIKRQQKNRLFWPLLALTCLCYFSGFKRIGVFGLVLSLLVGWLLALLTRGREGRRGWLLFFSLAVVMGLFLYLFIVRAGLFEYLEREFGINSMGRRLLTDFIEPYYHIGPDYLGRGAGFTSRLFSSQPVGQIRALHNDILVLYIDLGFWGFWLWMLAFFPLRVWVVAKRQGVWGGILCACCCLNILATALTDNTIYYVYVIGAAAILPMGGVFFAPAEAPSGLPERNLSPGSMGGEWR